MDRCLLFSLKSCDYVRAPEHVGGDPIPYSSADAERFIRLHADQRLVIADPDGGWIQHDGGECPVAPDFRVDLKFACGEVHRNREAVEWVWTSSRSLRQIEANITAWRPAQEERDGLSPCSVCGRPTGGCCTVADHSTESTVASPPLSSAVAGPVTPDAAGVGGVRGAMELIRAWPCVQPGCDGNGYPVQVGHGEWEQAQCQFCDERKRVLAILAALPEGELIDAGEWNLDPRHGFMTIPEPGRMIATGTFSLVRDGICEPGTYRVFLQRKEVG